MNKSTYSEKNGKLFYAVLALSVMAVIAAAVGISFTTKKIKSTNEKPTQTSIDWDNNSAVVSETEANKHESGVADDRTTVPVTEPTESTQQETEPAQETTAANATTEKTVECFLPLSSSILKDYSYGTLVKSKTMNDWRTHNGVDFTGELGDEVRAICAGTVKEVTTDTSWGKVVVVEHENGVTAKYCGFEDVIVAPGEKVRAQDVLGTLGVIPVESTDAAHLHFETVVDGKYTDPIKAMSLSRDDD